MKITLKNFQIVPAINFLSEVSLKGGKASRARMKLINKLDGKRAEFAEEVNSIKHEEDSMEYQEESLEIFNETSTIDLTEYADKMEILFTALEDYEGTLSGQEAGVHDLILDKLEPVIESYNESQVAEDSELMENE